MPRQPGFPAFSQCCKRESSNILQSGSTEDSGVPQNLVGHSNQPNLPNKLLRCATGPPWFHNLVLPYFHLSGLRSSCGFLDDARVCGKIWPQGALCPRPVGDYGIGRKKVAIEFVHGHHITSAVWPWLSVFIALESIASTLPVQFVKSLGQKVSIQLLQTPPPMSPTLRV